MYYTGGNEVLETVVTVHNVPLAPDLTLMLHETKEEHSKLLHGANLILKKIDMQILLIRSFPLLHLLIK